jgi:NTE family protein
VGEEAVVLGPRRNERIVVEEPARLGCLTRAAFERVFRQLLADAPEGPAVAVGSEDSSVPARGDHPRVGLALASGGALAIAHVGVLHVLRRESIPIAAVAGSSGGALFGALFCRGLSLERIVEFAGELVRLVRRRGGLWDLAAPPVTGLIRGELTTRLYEEVLGGACFSDLAVPLEVAATDLVTGETVILASGTVAGAVRASMGVPGVYEPCRVGDRYLVDGGFSDPSGAGAPILRGCDLRICSVTLDDPDEMAVAVPALPGPHLLSLITARANALLGRLPATALEPEADVVIRPELSSFSVLDYSRAEELIAAGAAAAEAKLPELRRKLGRTP